MTWKPKERTERVALETPKPHGDTLTHLDADGKARMVDVSAKDATKRTATAQAVVIMSPATLSRLRRNELEKGDALAVARIAGIQAAKRTDELIPLCHTLPLTDVSIDFSFHESGRLTISTTATTIAQTGVEMEALTAATVAALTIYDMTKGVDKRLVIGEIHLVSKTGGKSGEFAWTD